MKKRKRYWCYHDDPSWCTDKCGTDTQGYFKVTSTWPDIKDYWMETTKVNNESNPFDSRWPAVIRTDGRVEYLCMHRIGHSNDIHGCDGCCGVKFKVKQFKKGKRSRR